MTQDRFRSPDVARTRLVNSSGHGYYTGVNAPGFTNPPIFDVQEGLLHGYQPNFNRYNSNSAYSPRNVIPFLMDAPLGFNWFPDPDFMVGTLKSLMTTQYKTISGLKNGVNATYKDRQVSNAGHMFYDMTNVTEEISKVTVTWDERYGRSINRFWEIVIRGTGMDPITKQPGVCNFDFDIDPPTTWLNNFYSFAMLFVVPDPLMRYADEAWLMIGMAPETSGSFDYGYEFGEIKDSEISIDFVGTPIRGPGVMQLAQDKLNERVYTNAGPLNQPPPFTRAAPVVDKQTHVGENEGIAHMHKQGVPFNPNGGYDSQTGGEVPTEFKKSWGKAYSESYNQEDQ